MKDADDCLLTAAADVAARNVECDEEGLIIESRPGDTTFLDDEE